MAVSAWQNLLQQHRVVAVIRAGRADVAREMALAAAAGGMKLLEVTWDTERADTLIPKLQQELPDCKIGTGTLRSIEEVRQAIACGCKFLFSPHTDLDAIAIARAADVPIVPGALTPTEIQQAWQAGAAAVKVFPIQCMGGADYLRSLHPVFRDIPLIPTGGIAVEDVTSYLEAGAIAVGLSTDLFPPAAVATKDWPIAIARCRMLLQSVQRFQGRSTGIPGCEPVAEGQIP